VTVLLWKVLDSRVVDAYLETALWVAGLAIVAVLLPRARTAEHGS
jgi:hypothetical protein